MQQGFKAIFVDLFSLKSNKWQKIVLYALCGIAFIGYMIMYYVLEIDTFDHYYYMNAVRSYFETGDCYVHGFVYLDYFCYLFAFFLAPFVVNLFIRLSTNMIICLIFLNLQKKNTSNINLVYWIYANYYLLYNDIIQLNVNSLIPLVFYVYYIYREKYPWTSLLLLLCLYKVNTIIILGGILLLDLFFKRINKKIFRDILYLIPVGIIVSLSLLNSIRIGFLDAEFSQGYGIEALIMAFQPQHLFSYSVLLLILLDKILQKQVTPQANGILPENYSSQIKLTDEKIKQIWKIYFILMIFYNIVAGVILFT